MAMAKKISGDLFTCVTEGLGNLGSLTYSMENFIFISA